jgi:perosamine synthetase
LERIDGFIARKRRMGCRYRALLEDIPGLQLPLAATAWAENIYWVYGLCLNEDIPFDAGQVTNRLDEMGIGTRPFFWPLHEQPVFRQRGLFAGESYPVSEHLARRGFYIPSGLALTDAQMDRVAVVLHEVLK